MKSNYRSYGDYCVILSTNPVQPVNEYVMPKSVLIVDDDPVQRRLLEEVIKKIGYETRNASSGAEALSILTDEHKTIAIILLDLVMPDMDGIQLLEQLDHEIPVVVQTAHGSIDTAIKAMKAGACDFVVKPVSPERLEVSIKNSLKINALEGEIKRIKLKSDGKLTFENLITQSPSMDRVIALGKRAAASNIPVLIEGESGVGKEVIARAIQGESERAGQPFVTVNCGAIPENLVESILFGHEKGAFTGATDKRKGKFVEANGGTLFLDEIGELPLDAQVKLLRALQENEIDPVGSNKSVKVDFRLISATNRDMIEHVKNGKFREDLYYRLNVFPVIVPPLRERREDIPNLVEHFVSRFSVEEGKRIEHISPDVFSLLQNYSWPGNVRQLENVVFRAVVLADSSVLSVREFPQIAAHVEGFESEIPQEPTLEPQNINKGPAMIGTDIPLTPVAELPNNSADGEHHMIGIPALGNNGEVRPLEDIEADMIRLAMNRYRGHMTEIAKRLGIGRSTLYRKMREFGLEPRIN